MKRATKDAAPPDTRFPKPLTQMDVNKTRRKQRGTMRERPAENRWHSITKNKGIMKKIQKWMKKENKMFSVIGGEKFKNGDVVYTHAGLLLFLVAIGVVGALVQ